MDVIEFIKEQNRMCNTIKECRDCPVYECGECIVEHMTNIKYLQEAVEIIEKWSKENPVKTRQTEFLKLFPNANLVNDTLIFCPHCIDATFECKSFDCFKCRNNYWMQEVE